MFLVNINQGALSNWVSGGEESVLGVNALFNYAINFRSGKNTWDNYFDLALGFQNATSFGSFRKIDDRIDVTSKYGHSINHHWYIGVLTNFNSQTLAGYDYNEKGTQKISDFLTPGKIILSPGMDYKTISRFSLFTSPVTVRWVLKEDEEFLHLAKFGVILFSDRVPEQRNEIDLVICFSKPKFVCIDDGIRKIKTIFPDIFSPFAVRPVIQICCSL